MSSSAQVQNSNPPVSRSSTEQSPRALPPSSIEQRRSIQFDQSVASSPSRDRRSIGTEQMPSANNDLRRSVPVDPGTDESDSEIRPIASAGGGRNYNTTSTATENHTDGEDVPVLSSSSRKPSQSQEDQKSEKITWYRRVVENYGTMELDNKGSVARDHLALERTFLAWLRTSLAFASIGIAITQLFRLNTSISSGNSSRKRLEYSPYIGYTIPAPDEDDISSPYIQDDQSVLALLTSPHPNAIPASTAQHLRQLGKPLGATFLGVSIVVLFIGFHRYFESQHWIIRGKFPASRSSVAIVGMMSAGLIVACLVVILAVGGKSFEN